MARRIRQRLDAIGVPRADGEGSEVEKPLQSGMTVLNQQFPDGVLLDEDQVAGASDTEDSASTEVSEAALEESIQSARMALEN